MGYGDLLGKAFSTAWKYKYLWLLGFFVAGMSIPSSQFDFGEHDIDRFGSYFSPAEWGFILFIGIAILFVILILLVLNRICAGGLIANTARIERAESHNLSLAWDAGLRYFWRLVGLFICFLFLFIGTAGIAVVLGIIAAAIETVLLILSLIVLIPLLFACFFVLAIIGSYAERFIVLENQGVFTAIESGFRLFKKEPGKSTAMGFIALIVSVSLGIGAWITFMIMIVPLVGIGMLNLLAALIPGLLIVLPLMILVSAYLGTYRSCLWTFFFMQFRGTPAAAAAPLPPDAQSPAPTAPSASPPQFE